MKNIRFELGEIQRLELPSEQLKIEIIKVLSKLKAPVKVHTIVKLLMKNKSPFYKLNDGYRHLALKIGRILVNNPNFFEKIKQSKRTNRWCLRKVKK